MAKQNHKDKPKKNTAGPGIANDQLGENASETMRQAYDNKRPKKK